MFELIVDYYLFWVFLSGAVYLQQKPLSPFLYKFDLLIAKIIVFLYFLTRMTQLSIMLCSLG